MTCIKMAERRIVCVYGSVTGKAESIAEQLVDTAKSKGVQVPLSIVRCTNIKDKFSFPYDPYSINKSLSLLQF